MSETFCSVLGVFKLKWAKQNVDKWANKIETIGSKSSSQRKVPNKQTKKAFKIKCQSKCHQTIYSNRADLTLVALQTFMFDCPSCTKKLSTDGEKLRLTISNCSQLLRTDCRPNCRVNVLYTTRVKCTAENGPTHVVVRAAVTVDSW